MEKTLIVVKPDGVKRGLVGEILSRFEKAGLKIIGMKGLVIDKNLALKHYGFGPGWFEKVGQKVKDFYKQVGFDAGEDFNKLSHEEIGKLVQKWNVDYLVEGFVAAIVLEGPNAVSVARKLTGSTYPSEAAAGTIRGDFSLESPLEANLQKRSVRNLIHASGSPEEAKTEIQLWFKENEIFDK